MFPNRHGFMFQQLGNARQHTIFVSIDFSASNKCYHVLASKTTKKYFIENFPYIGSNILLAPAWGGHIHVSLTYIQEMVISMNEGCN